MEIERKFLLKRVPLFVEENASVRSTLQVLYPAVVLDESGNILREIRVRRRIGGMWEDKITYKGSGYLLREEVEQKTPDGKFFDLLQRALRKTPIKKDYYRCDYDGYKIEVSVVDPGTDTSFVYGEVEFDSESNANSFVWPFSSDLEREITNEPVYKMANYWVRTRGL